MRDEGVSLYNDVLYRCPLAKDQWGTCLPCANINPAPMPLRLLQYNTATIVDHLKQGHKTFPVVVNMVVYHVRHEVAHTTCMPMHTKGASTPYWDTLGAWSVILEC